METKKYSIDGREFTLKTDHTLKEIDKISKFLNMGNYTNNQVSYELTAEQQIEVIALLVEPIEPSKEQVDFMNTKESVLVKIIHDFFEHRIRLSISTQDSMKHLMNESLMPNLNVEV